jgi:hypothetical protein
MRHRIRTNGTLSLTFLFFFCLGQGVAAEVSLAWDASTSPNIIGYKIYRGTASGSYDSPILIGNQTSYTVTGLTAATYYFSVTAVNASGEESGFSNEVTTTISGTGSVTCDLNSDGGVNVLDLQRMVNIVLGISSFSSNYDLNKDGKIDVLDIQIINNVVLGLRSCQ